MKMNIHGLSRHIPADVKREVRQRSKHGCVFCRAMIYQYEHIEPEFANALVHDPDAICLLCPSCHTEVTTGRLSKQEVTKAYHRVQTSTQMRPPHHQMRVYGPMRLGLGASTFDFLFDDFSILDYDGESVLGIRYKDDPILGGVYPAMSGIISDKAGKTVVGITDNEITLATSDLDIEAVGRVIRIRNAPSLFDLQFTFDPPGGVQIDRLLMRFKEIEIDTRDDFGLIGPTIKGARARCLVGPMRASGSTAAVAYNSDRSSWREGGISAIGGVGIVLPFMGATIAKGASSMTIPKIRFGQVE